MDKRFKEAEKFTMRDVEVFEIQTKREALAYAAAYSDAEESCKADLHRMCVRYLDYANLMDDE